MTGVSPRLSNGSIAPVGSIVQRAATLNANQLAGRLTVRVTNESGHKLPTGHIEGRRVFVNVQMFDASDALVREYGHYDWETAELDEASTSVYEMHVGLSPAAVEAQLHAYRELVAETRRFRSEPLAPPPSP